MTLWAVDHVGRGGIGRYVVDLATLVGDGADVALAVPEGGTSPGAGAPISTWFPRPRDRRRRSALRAAATGLARAAKGTARGDVAWLQLGLRPRYELALAAVLRLRGVRLVATVHNRAPHTGARSGRAVIAAARLCHRVVVHTHELEEWGKAHRLRWARLPFLTPDLDAATRHGAGPVEGLDRASLGISEDAVVVLFLGYLRRYKGPDVLLEALAQVHACDESTPLHVVVAGAPTKDLDLAQVAQGLSLGSGLTLRSDWLADEEMSALLDLADAVVLPYRTIDNSGIAALARERALPVVASDLPLMRETFGAEAAYVRPGDVDDLAGALRRLPRDLVAMRDAARAAVEASAAAPIAAAYHSLLDDLAISPPSRQEVPAARGRGGISVVMATFNGVSYLQEQLESLAAQTLLPDELVVGDDGSSDGTQDLVRAFAESAPFPVRLFQHGGLGVTDNFLATAAQARSPWIAWSDQDDVWSPHKLSASMDALIRQDAVLVFHEAHVVDDRLHRTGRTLGQWRYDELARFAGHPWEVFHGFATVFAADLLGGIDAATLPPSTLHAGRWHHDELVHELARLTGTRALISEPLALYRQHTSNTAGMPRQRSTAWRATITRDGYERRLEASTLTRVWARSVPRLAADPKVDRYLARRVQDETRRVAIWDRETSVSRLVVVGAGALSGTYGRRLAGRQGLLSLAKDVLGSVSLKGGIRR